MRNDLIVLDRKARRELEQLVTDGNTAQKIAKRARIVLMTADGHGVVAIMREVGVSKTTVWRWQDYFAEAGVDGLIKGRSKPPGRKPLSAAMKLKVVEKTVKERPANATHWSVRSMAEEMGISHTSVQRIWAEHGLKPHPCAASRSPTIPTSSRRSKTSSAFTSIRRRRRWCFPSVLSGCNCSPMRAVSSYLSSSKSVDSDTQNSRASISLLLPQQRLLLAFVLRKFSCHRSICRVPIKCFEHL